MEYKVVSCREGQLRGRVEGDMAVFMRVPYAAPPTGDLRWRGPQPAEPWAGIRDALSAPPMPVQMHFPGSRLKDHEMSEDCLYLNIWAPAEPKVPCPILVWFYGGALQGGNADSAVYEGRICSGDAFIASRAQKESIRQRFGGLCCEMEGAAIAQTCHLNHVPWVVIRAISDSADDSEELSFALFAEAAAREGARIVREMVGQLR